jgi:NADH-quinone oxidoreductase subunit A
MFFDFAVVLAFLLVAALAVAGGLVVGRFVRPQLPDADKSKVYECGELPIGTGRFNFNPRFYVMALVFIVFDVEVALTFPVAVVARSWIAVGKAGTAVIELGIFLLVLVAALAYVWAKGDLDWIRTIENISEDA